MAIAAMKRLRDGIRRSVWTEAELEALRRGVRNPAWGVLSGALVVFGIVSVVTDHGFGHAGLLPLVILPFHMRMQIAQVIRPVANSPDRIDWNGSAAIRSERWGEPPSGTVR